MLRKQLRAGVFVGALLWLHATTATLCPAGTIAYGNFGPVPPGISFLSVTESSGTDNVPLYGPPDPFSVGLDFDPTSFVSTASGGALDVTDGQLNFTIVGSNAFPINSLGLFESGDYTLLGPGTVNTRAIAGVNIRATVTQINGVDVAPISLTPFNDSVSFNFVSNPGVLQNWSLPGTLNIASQLGVNQRATKVEIAIDNQLLTASETTSLAFIAKKDFRVNVGTSPPIPEPGVLLLALSGSAMFAVLTRRHRF